MVVTDLHSEIHVAGEPLIIDPGLAYSTYLGGSGSEILYGIAVDGAGNAYVTGATDSTDFLFPFIGGGLGAAVGTSAFVTKQNATGPPCGRPYLGGGGEDIAVGIAVNAAGSAYIAGVTSSSDFPTTQAHFDTALSGASDIFVARLQPSGNAFHLLVLPRRT